MTLTIKRTSCTAGARQARGFTVVIDVFRAFSCAPIVYSLGVKRLILEPDPDRALTFKTGPEVVLMGEVNELPIPGFDLGNSPTEILNRGRDFFLGKTVVQRTTAGVTGVRAALDAGADEVALGGFSTAKAVAAYIKARNPSLVTIVPMGARGQTPAPEDEACADYLESLLTGSRYDHLEALKTVAFQETAQKFLRGDKEYLPREDPLFCLQRDLFDFVLTAREVEGVIEVFQHTPGSPGA